MKMKKKRENQKRGAAAVWFSRVISSDVVYSIGRDHESNPEALDEYIQQRSMEQKGCV